MHQNSSIPFRLGIRAHDLGRFSAVELARRVRAEGMDCVQLALGKAIEGMEMQVETLNAEMASEIRAAFDKYEVRIEVLGCYINPIHPDLVSRAILLDLFKEHLRHARDFGCQIVALESGSLNADQSFNSGNSAESAYQELLASIKDLVFEAERFGVVVGIEAVTSHVLSTPEKTLRLLDDVGSSHLQVIFDPVNLLSFENYRQQREIIGSAFELFGDRIAVIHAKDFNTSRGEIVAAGVGDGILDYSFLLRQIADWKLGIAVLLEGACAGQVSVSRSFILNQAFAQIS